MREKLTLAPSPRQREVIDRFLVKKITPDGLIGLDQFNQTMKAMVPAHPEDQAEGRVSFTSVWDLAKRGERCDICGLGWSRTYESLCNQTRNQARETFRHLSCDFGHRLATEHDMWYSIFASLMFVWKQEFINNGYSGLEDNALFQGTHWVPEWDDRYIGANGIPWSKFTLMDINTPYVEEKKSRTLTQYTITAGPRKRVWEIVFGGLNESEVKACIATFDDVTDTKSPKKDGYVIHAYTRQQCLEYMRRFRPIVAHVLTEKKA